MFSKLVFVDSERECIPHLSPSFWLFSAILRVPWCVKCIAPISASVYHMECSLCVFSVSLLCIIKSYLTLCDPLDCSTPGFAVHHQPLELAQTDVHWLSDAIQASHSLPSPSPRVFNLSQHLGLFQWVNSLHQVAKVLELQLQQQSFQWIFRIDFSQTRIDWFDLL